MKSNKDNSCVNDQDTLRDLMCRITSSLIIVATLKQIRDSCAPNAPDVWFLNEPNRNGFFVYDSLAIGDIVDDGLDTIKGKDGRIYRRVELTDGFFGLFYGGEYTTSATGQTIVVINHGTGIDSKRISVEPSSPDAAGFSMITTDTDNIYVHYDVSPRLGTDNLKYHWTITR